MKDGFSTYKTLLCELCVIFVPFVLNMFGGQ